MESMRDTIVNECLELIKKDEVKKEVKELFKPIINMILKDIYPYIFISMLFVTISFLLILGIFNSKILTPLNIIWMKFGLILGGIVSPTIMGIIFFGVVTPVGLLMRLFKKDLLNLRMNNEKSYWIEKDKKIISSMKDQF